MNRSPLIDTHQHPIPDYYKRALASVRRRDGQRRESMGGMESR